MCYLKYKLSSKLCKSHFVQSLDFIISTLFASLLSRCLGKGCVTSPKKVGG